MYNHAPCADTVQGAIFMRKKLRSILAGLAAGAVNGLFGAGGGMVLVPILSSGSELQEEEVFSSSIVIILPICIVSLVAGSGGQLPWSAAWPYLIGAVAGGLAAGIWGNRIATKWLHRILGVMILYGGFRYLC
jgi:uncharacterized membrane protein YfcA